MKNFLTSHETARSNSWEVIKYLLRFLWPKDCLNFRLRLVLAFSSLALSKVIAVWVPIYYKKAIDSLNISSESTLLIVPIGLLLAYGMARILASLFSELRDAVFAKVEHRAIRNIALMVFEHLHTLSLRYHLDRKTGGLSRSIERGTQAIESLLKYVTLFIFPTFIEIILVCGLLAYMYEVIFSLITLVTMLSYGGLTILLTQWRAKFLKQMNASDEESNSKAIDSLLNYETVKYFGNEEHERLRYDVSLSTYEKAAVKLKISLSVLNIGQSIIISAGLTIVMLLAAQRISTNTMSIGDFVLLNTYLMQLYWPLSNLGWAYREIKRGFIDLDSMFSLLKVPIEVKDPPNCDPIDMTEGAVLFENVSFSYTNTRSILKDVSFSIPAGKRVAMVGASGAGKSTIARLLFRFYDVTEGSISIDGQNIQSVPQKSLRHQIGVVPQDTVLFNDSLHYNIAYGNPNASKEEVLQVIKLAHLEAFIEKLPEGLDTLVGERGLKLSGGEKQRVAIARALLKQPKIFIFDEATSALDTHTEKEIQENLREISQEHTTLIIAHRLSTIVDADEILVLDNGEVTERGTHHELLSLKGMYAKMWTRQQEKQKEIGQAA
ncbi:MAG: ABC transporter ATP-binding protein/permease [Alphaproteobacteria bacterium]|jgi:ATP-binding cassette, subfamily B, heavy metal transporter|nr:ABC transporter ATP-binding protein/permease [Alphaproteobacteria bacterium]MBT5389457.1 ABC transporter ATP-binding protein/permease [Alphaproteobacteria bacterium]MBT5540498.1 ABC transporter ATP-binding protein/permease [Alphaproteobacteria bacterium]MBT5654352.1 ABC transporter ATP-binding protein/permease [Alphaproteobacteria bacterium]